MRIPRIQAILLLQNVEQAEDHKPDESCLLCTRFRLHIDEDEKYSIRCSHHTGAKKRLTKLTREYWVQANKRAAECPDYEVDA